MDEEGKARVHINAGADYDPEVLIFDPTKEFFTKFCETFNIAARMTIDTTQVAIYRGNGFSLKLFCDIPGKEENQ